MMKKSSTLYDQVVEITENYLGPPAKRFIDRQIESHLNKKPGMLTRKDLESLNDWIIAVFSLLTEDEHIQSEYAERLESLK